MGLFIAYFIRPALFYQNILNKHYMRVQTSPHHSPRKNPILGYRVSPQQHGSTLVASKKLQVTTQPNYQHILDDERNRTQSSTTNLLPINFCHTPGQYNKLLITNGRKGIIDSHPRQEVGVPTVEFLNSQVHKQNQEKQEKMKELYKLKEESRQKSTVVQLEDCNCCCCENFCQICSEEMHFNFDHQPILSDIPSVSLDRVNKHKVRSPVRRVIQIQPEKQEWINRSQLSRSERLKKRKVSASYSAEEPQSYQKIKPLLERSVEKQKELEYYQLSHNPHTVAQEKIDRIRGYDERRKMLASKSVKVKEFHPQHPWGYHEPEERVAVDKYCHAHHHPHHYPDGILLKKYTEVKKKKEVEEEQKAPCHPHGSLSPEVAEMKRKLLGYKAYSKLHKDREQKIQQKIRITQNLRKLESQRKQIMQKAPKETFKPSNAQIQKAFQNQVS